MEMPDCTANRVPTSIPEGSTAWKEDSPPLCCARGQRGKDEDDVASVRWRMAASTKPRRRASAAGVLDSGLAPPARREGSICEEVQGKGVNRVSEKRKRAPCFSTDISVRRESFDMTPHLERYLRRSISGTPSRLRCQCSSGSPFPLSTYDAAHLEHDLGWRGISGASPPLRSQCSSGSGSGGRPAQPPHDVRPYVLHLPLGHGLDEVILRTAADALAHSFTLLVGRHHLRGVRGEVCEEVKCEENKGSGKALRFPSNPCSPSPPPPVPLSCVRKHSGGKHMHSPPPPWTSPPPMLPPKAPPLLTDDRHVAEALV